MKKTYVTLLAAGLLIYTQSAWAAQWELDKDHSEIGFRVNHILTPVSGRFTDFSGDLVFDPKTPGKGKFDFRVDVDSVDTHNGKRDNHLRSKDFFDAKKFPVMQFKSSNITLVRDGVYALDGRLTIKGVSRDIRIEFEFRGPRPHPFEKTKMVGGFITKFTLDRLDFGVGSGKFLNMGVVGKEVTVEIQAEALAPRE